MLEKIFSTFKDFKSSPITYIIFMVVIGFSYNVYTTGKEKTMALKECQDEQKRLNQRFQDMFFKKEKTIENDSLIQNLNN